jgi:hypothetical protein
MVGLRKSARLWGRTGTQTLIKSCHFIGNIRGRSWAPVSDWSPLIRSQFANSLVLKQYWLIDSLLGSLLFSFLLRLSPTSAPRKFLRLQGFFALPTTMRFPTDFTPAETTVVVSSVNLPFQITLQWIQVIVTPKSLMEIQILKSVFRKDLHRRKIGDHWAYHSAERFWARDSFVPACATAEWCESWQ